MTWMATTGGGRVPAYDRVDARIAKDFVGGYRYEWAVVVQSMFGSHHEQTPDRNFGRRYYTTLRFRM
jgi:hypothetical protein